jgi:hypothetical protein
VVKCVDPIPQTRCTISTQNLTFDHFQNNIPPDIRKIKIFWWLVTTVPHLLHLVLKYHQPTPKIGYKRVVQSFVPTPARPTWLHVPARGQNWTLWIDVAQWILIQNAHQSWSNDIKMFPCISSTIITLLYIFLITQSFKRFVEKVRYFFWKFNFGTVDICWYLSL